MLGIAPAFLDKKILAKPHLTGLDPTQPNFEGLGHWPHPCQNARRFWHPLAKTTTRKLIWGINNGDLRMVYGGFLVSLTIFNIFTDCLMGWKPFNSHLVMVYTIQPIIIFSDDLRMVYEMEVYLQFTPFWPQGPPGLFGHLAHHFSPLLSPVSMAGPCAPTPWPAAPWCQPWGGPDAGGRCWKWPVAVVVVTVTMAAGWCWNMAWNGLEMEAKLGLNSWEWDWWYFYVQPERPKRHGGMGIDDWITWMGFDQQVGDIRGS